MGECVVFYLGDDRLLKDHGVLECAQQQPGPGHSQILTYLQAGMHPRPLKLHPLLELTMWDPKYVRILD